MKPIFGSRFAWVFLAQVLLVVVYPLCRGSVFHEQLLALFHALILLATIRATLTRRRLVKLITGLGLAGLLTRIIGAGLESSVWVQLSDDAFLLFYLIAMLAVFGYVLEKGRVTVDKIAAALCVYFFLALFWGLAYEVVESVRPGSFAFAGPLAPAGEEPDSSLFLYYSLVTVTTLGYGDITPVSPFARSLAAMEAMIGQIYITVLVARLVALHIAHAGPPADRG